jgi:transcriptional/translational regulatory protein YebC/TACO1
VKEEIFLEDRYSASYKIKVPKNKNGAEEEVESKVAERKYLNFNYRPETQELLAHHYQRTLNLISRNLEAKRRNSNETSVLKICRNTRLSHRMDSIQAEQPLQIEIIDIDEDLEDLAKVYLNVEPNIARIRDALSRCVHLMDGADVQEHCDALYRGGQNN